MDELEQGLSSEESEGEKKSEEGERLDETKKRCPVFGCMKKREHEGEHTQRKAKFNPVADDSAKEKVTKTLSEQLGLTKGELIDVKAVTRLCNATATSVLTLESAICAHIAGEMEAKKNGVTLEQDKNMLKAKAFAFPTKDEIEMHGLALQIFACHIIDKASMLQLSLLMLAIAQISFCTSRIFGEEQIRTILATVMNEATDS